jgi:VIT1/CCC1 family predicted Fe2+/Mn2+ transporter
MHSLHRENHLIERIGWLRAAVLGANDGAGDYQGELFGNDCEGMCGV